MRGEQALKTPFFFNKEQFMLLLSCNGIENVDLSAADARTVRFYDEMVKNGFVDSSEEPMGKLESYQRYHIYKGTYLDSIHYSVTGKCNFRCRHCLVSAPTAVHPEPDLAQIERAADQMKECGIRLVDITGGEPLVRKDFIDVVKAFTSRKIQIRTIFTNTALLNAGLLDQIEAAGQQPAFQISYDGFGCHDWLRGVNGAEEQAKAACRLLSDRGYPFAVGTCIHKGNAGSIRPLWQYLKDTSCVSVNVNAIQDLGEWKQYADEYALSNEEVWEVYSGLIRDWFEDGMPIDLLLDGFFKGTKGKTAYKVPYVKHAGKASLEKLPYCESVRHGAYLSPEGGVMPCMGFSSTAIADSFPNLYTGGTTLGDITSDPESFYYKVQRTTVADMANCREENPECLDCEYLKKCLGGCMLEGTTPEGNYLHRDERICWFFKNVGEDKVRSIADAAIKEFCADHPGDAADQDTDDNSHEWFL